DGVVVTLAECEELAPSEHAPNGFVLAARYASRMLPQIFQVDDVLLEVEFPVNERLPLEKLMAELPPRFSPPTIASAGSISSGRARRRTRSTRAVRRSTAGLCQPSLSSLPSTIWS